MQWLRNLLGGGKQSQVPVDRITVKKVSASLYEYRIDGVLTKPVLDKLHAIAENQIQQGTKDLRALILLNGFKGWRRGDDWGDLDFFMQHGDSIAKIAVVGDLKWKQEVFGFLLVGNRRGEVRYFTPAQETEARAWLV